MIPSRHQDMCRAKSRSSGEVRRAVSTPPLPFRLLGTTDLSKLAACCRMQQYKNGDVILTEGEVRTVHPRPDSTIPPSSLPSPLQTRLLPSPTWPLPTIPTTVAEPPPLYFLVGNGSSFSDSPKTSRRFALVARDAYLANENPTYSVTA